MADSLDTQFSRVRLSRLAGQTSLYTSYRSPFDLTQDRVISFADILYLIYAAGLPGPAVTVGDKLYIGTGAQFVVLGTDMVIAPDREPIRVAIKQPKFNLDARKRLDMEDPETKKHLRSIQLEIKALTRPELHSHPNITTLLAWTYDADDFRNSISLVQELAISNMELLLSTRGEEISAAQKSLFCYDIAAALDAIHGCSFSHGDVKPSNVLIFQQKDGFIAKLADFGLSIVGTEGEEAKFNLGGTLGWQAPEAQEGRLFGPDEIIKADNYSFGLVVWSTILGLGRTPPSHSGKAREEWIIHELNSAKQSQDYPTFAALMPMTRVVLKADPAERPSRLLELIHVNTLQDEFSHARTTNDDGFSGIVVPLTPLVPADFHWELPTLPDFFIKDLHPYGIENSGTLDPAMLFSLFLRLTQKGTGEWETESTRALLEAAKRGFPPAQALVPLVFASYGQPMPPEIHDQLDGWLASAICSGSFTARKYLEATNPDAALAALQQFRDIGGYSIPYLNYSSLHALHAAAVHGTRDDVLSRLAMDSNLSIEDKTVDGETPLYIACARGCWEIAAELLNRGADASVRCTRYGITCLHWLFAFEPTLQPAVITGLIKAGADVNAIVTESIPFYHFPFYLPGGSPLDWAVVTASDGTVEILLQHGADPALRDASTPYAYDRRITTIDSFGGPHQDGYSADMVGMGLSSLDYAALYHESCIFECLRRSPTMIDINAADNEGLTVLHRLSSHHIHYTRKLSYSFIPFRGDQNLLKSRLARTVAAIKALGGDLDKLTTPLTPFQYIQGEWRFEGLTPLMLATLDGNYAVAQALVDAGADVDKETDYGNTALHMSSAKFRAEDYAWDIHVAKILVEAGATVHRENKLGHTPLCLAAGEYGGLERFELFLQNGGDIGDTDNHPGSAQYRLGVFSLMARPDPPFDESRDLRAASLLEEFLFSNRDVKKRDSVISHVNENGETMLHRFAAAHMRHSIDALLRHGVPALVFARIHTFEKIQGEIVDVTRAETPLDRAIEAKEEYERDISKAMRHSLLEFEDICKRADAVIGALKAAGCQRCKSLVSIIGPEPLDGARPWVA